MISIFASTPLILEARGCYRYMHYNLCRFSSQYEACSIFKISLQFWILSLLFLKELFQWCVRVPALVSSITCMYVHLTWVRQCKNEAQAWKFCSGRLWTLKYYKIRFLFFGEKTFSMEWNGGDHHPLGLSNWCWQERQIM